MREIVIENANKIMEKTKAERERESTRERESV